MDLVEVSGRMYLETMPLRERHHLVQLVSWLMVDLAGRLEAAWRARALRYSHMEKDFDASPNWYQEMTKRLSNWRERGVHKR